MIRGGERGARSKMLTVFEKKKSLSCERFWGITMRITDEKLWCRNTQRKRVALLIDDLTREGPIARKKYKDSVLLTRKGVVRVVSGILGGGVF